MMAKYLRLLLVLLLGAVTSCKTAQQIPQQSTGKDVKREFRGAWIQTAFQGEYKDMTPVQMRKDFIRKLNYLQKCGINAIIFQVRPEADAFYKSDIEPWSRFYTGQQGLAPAGDFDVMAFLIEECHKRNMEFHAWLNPYRASTGGYTRFADSHIYNKHPEWFVTYNKQILFDPGLPESRQFICRVVRDIVSRYDVDAIHMDDYFYPYPVAGMPFPDDNSFQKYGLNKGYKASQRADWRRENVNKLIREIKRTILLSKPWVRFGISPFGIYRNKKSTPDGSGSNTNGLQNYDDLYADRLQHSTDILGDRTPGCRLHHAYQMVEQKCQWRTSIYRPGYSPHHESRRTDPQDALRTLTFPYQRKLLLAGKRNTLEQPRCGRQPETELPPISGSDPGLYSPAQPGAGGGQETEGRMDCPRVYVALAGGTKQDQSRIGKLFRHLPFRKQRAGQPERSFEDSSDHTQNELSATLRRRETQIPLRSHGSRPFSQ